MAGEIAKRTADFFGMHGHQVASVSDEIIRQRLPDMREGIIDTYEMVRGSGHLAESFDALIEGLPTRKGNFQTLTLVGRDQIKILQEELKTAMPDGTNDFVAAEYIAGLLYAFKDVIGGGAERNVLNSPLVDDAYQELEATYTLTQPPATIDQTEQDDASRLQKNMDELFEAKNKELAEKATGWENRINKETSNAREELQALAATHKQALSADYTKLQSQLKDDVGDALDGTRAEGILRQAFMLWDDKEETHRRNFKNGVGVFVILIATTLCAAYTNWDAIKLLIAEAAQSSGGKPGDWAGFAQMFSRLLLISLPLGVGVWILRAVLRWANLNLSLAEDAAQRSVMAQTYVNLLAEGKINQDEDRQIMLSALFRPLPGVREVDISPTTILDIIKPQKPRASG